MGAGAGAKRGAGTAGAGNATGLTIGANGTAGSAGNVLVKTGAGKAATAGANLGNTEL